MTGQITKTFRKTAERKGGFGFIRDEGGNSRFFHAKDVLDLTFNQLCDLVDQGQVTVTFDPTNVAPSAKDNGLRAEKVRVAR